MEPGVPVQSDEEVESTEMEPALMGPQPEGTPPLQQQPQLAAGGPTPPPGVVSPLPQVAPSSPMVPYTIGRVDPVTGERTSITGMGQRAIAPNPNDAFWNRLRQRTANLPLAQTEAAVSAALRFQGMRQYQRDLDKGVSATEAFARAAPLIFSAPKQSSLGQAANFVRATTPKVAAPRVRDVGGVLYGESRDGSWTPLTQPKAVAPKVSPFDNEEYRSVLQEIRNVNQQIDNLGPGVQSGPDADALRDKLQFLQNSLRQIRQRAAQGGPAAAMSTRGAAPPRPSEVVRYTKEGRRAVFDSNSRQFIRYAE